MIGLVWELTNYFMNMNDCSLVDYSDKAFLLEIFGIIKRKISSDYYQQIYAGIEKTMGLRKFLILCAVGEVNMLSCLISSFAFGVHYQ